MPAAVFEGAELDDGELHVYCTLPGEADQVLTHLEEAPAQESPGSNSGTIAFVAVGGGSGTSERRAAAAMSRHGSSWRLAAETPRCYRFARTVRRLW